MDREPNPYAAPSTGSESPPIPTDLLGGRLRSTELGLRMVCVGMLMTSAAWIVGIIARLGAGGMGLPMATLGVVAMVGLLILNAGPLLCLTVPSGYGLRSFAFATVFAQGLAFLGFVSSLLIGGTSIAVGGLIVAMVAGSLFLFFLYRLTQCLRRSDLVRRTRQVSIFWSTVVFGFFPLAFVSSRTIELAAILIPAYMIALALATVAYAVLSNLVASAIRYPATPSL